jgi:hypothetical protein
VKNARLASWTFAVSVIGALLYIAALMHPGAAPVASPVAVTVTATAAAPAATVCREDQACFNPCTMGVNGLYPEHDPRHWMAGPCDLNTVLPGGAWFRVETAVVETGDKCVRDYVPTRLTVKAVAAPDGETVLAEDSEVTCMTMLEDNPLSKYDGDQPDLLDALYHSVASRL